MTIFNTSFKQTVRDELERRAEFSYTQDYLAPFIRVTSLIEEKEGNGLMGFTLGIPNNQVAQDISTVFSSPASTGNNVVGITYRNGPELVRINNPAGAGIPTPGVTGVDISSLYRGGFVLDTTVNFKFYTKAQYDYLYQTFFRPGTLVLIEFGYTANRTNNGTLDLAHPDTFRQLTTDFYSSKRSFSSEASPLRDYIVGIIVNYGTKLNENNEYEAEIKLTNAGEFAYSLGVKNTLIHLGQEVSRGRSVSTAQQGDSTPSTNRDTVTLPALSGTSIHNLFGNSETNFSDDIVYEIVKVDAQSDVNDVDKELTRDHIYASGDADADAHDFYMSLFYVVAKLIPNILSEIEQHVPLNSNIIPMLNNISRDLIRDRYTRVKYISELRSVDTNVVVNNEAIYDTESSENLKTNHFQRLRLEAYQTKYNTDENGNLFDLVDVTYARNVKRDTSKKDAASEKSTYRSQTFTGFFDKKKYAPIEEGVADLKGIYISYKTFKKLFLNSTTLLDALNKIFAAVSTSTYGMISLKVRYAEAAGEDRHHLIIYDASALNVDEISDPYTFNKKLQSEILNSDFDYGLSQAAAASIAAGYAAGASVGGAVQERLLIDYGLDPRIQNISGGLTSERNNNVANTGVVPVATDRKAGEERDRFNISSMGHFSSQIGLFELMPDQMYARAIDVDGLYKTLPSSATIDLTLQGISGFRYGEMFKVLDILPEPYRDSGMFFLTGYKHSITPNGWETNINGQYLARSPND